MKVLTFSRQFPKGHPKVGQPTWFVEKAMACLAETIPDWQMKPDFVHYDWLEYYNCSILKGHTIRSGNRWKAGDMASLRIWSGAPYRSKQIEFAQVEVKKVWPVTIIIDDIFNPIYTGDKLLATCEVAKNDGLTCDDVAKWFTIHPKSTGTIFTGQIICWSDKVDYSTVTCKPDLKFLNK